MRRTTTGATLRQVADEAGVSIATASRALAGSEPVSADKERRVREVARRLGYEPNRLAQSLRRRRTGSLGLVLPGFTNPFFFELIAQTVEVGKEAGFTVLVSGSEDPVSEVLRLARAQVVDGAVVVAAHRAPEQSRLRELHIPIVCFDRAPEDATGPVVQVDNERGAREVTVHLAAEGARRIAHVAGPDHVLASEPRRRGYRLGLADAGLVHDDRLEVTGDFTERAGYAAVRALLAVDPHIDGFVAANDLMAIGAMQALAELGRRVPDDVLVAGFDGIGLGEFTVPRLTTLAQPISQMARLAVGRLLDLVASGEVPDTREDVVVPGELVVRSSSVRRRTPPPGSASR